MPSGIQQEVYHYDYSAIFINLFPAMTSRGKDIFTIVNVITEIILSQNFQRTKIFNQLFQKDI
jgi:hypothetical protein